jgi:GNAT superfamily N-acetyltransferase
MKTLSAVSTLREAGGQVVAVDRLMRRTPPVAPRASSIRRAEPSDASAIHALIALHLDEGRLLPRDPDEVFLHSHRFVVAVDGERLLACADLAPLSRTVAEVRSLVVSADARSMGLGRQLIDDLVRRATAAGSRSCVRSRTRRRTSSSSGFRSSRMCGCPRRSKRTAGAVLNSGAAANMRSCSR